MGPSNPTPCWSLWILMLSGLLICGCTGVGSGTNALDDLTVGVPAPPSAVSADSSFGKFQEGMNASWPDYIPGDIPPLEGPIRVVMQVPGSHVRIFYEGVTKQQVIGYLELLQSQGFTLEYRIYVQEGFQDNSAERQARGDYDAVDILKGEYQLNISYGPDPTLDIYTSAFQAEMDRSVAVEWPAEVPSSVPPIPDCPLFSVETVDPDRLRISCTAQRETVGDDYIELLLAAGYQQREGTTYKNMVYEMPLFENGEAIIIPSNHFFPMYSIQVVVKSDVETNR